MLTFLISLSRIVLHHSLWHHLFPCICLSFQLYQMQVQPMLGFPKPGLMGNTVGQGTTQVIGQIVQAPTKADGRSNCQHCGYPRREHQVNNYGLEKCNQNYCFVCSKTLIAHQRQAAHLNITNRKNIMGPNCIFKK